MAAILGASSATSAGPYNLPNQHKLRGTKLYFIAPFLYSCSKAFLTAGDKQLAIKFHVPAAVAAAKNVSLQEWIDALTAPVKDHMEIIEQTEETATLIVPANAEAGRFPLKMRDDCTAAGFAFLREKGLIPADDSSDDDVNYAEAAGVEW